MELFGVLVNLDLLAVGVATAAVGILGFIIFLQNTTNTTNRAFLIFSITTILWGAINYTTYQTLLEPALTFWLVRTTAFLGVLHAFSLFRLLYVFPADRQKFPPWYRLGVIPAVVGTAALTLTPLVFQEIGIIDASGRILEIINGPAISIFGITVVALIVGGILIFAKKTLRATGSVRKQSFVVLIGILATFVLLIVFNFVLPAFFNNPRYIPLGPVFLLPFIIAISYVLRHGFLNIKVMATEFITFILAMVTLIEVVFAHDIQILILRTSIFLLVLSFGLLLIRSVLNEVRAREEIERLAGELKRLSDSKSQFLSIASHQLRTPLTIVKGYISLLREGSFGAVPVSMEKTLNKIAISNERLIKLVADLLDLSRMETGKLQYSFEDFDFASLVSSVEEELRIAATDKNIPIVWAKKDTPIMIYADQWKIRQVVFNLIDNAIKYTKSGTIEIRLESDDNNITLAISDTGIGMSKETSENLFKKFERGPEALKDVKIEGTGLGIFIASIIVMDHNGNLSASSPGEGKGSTFVLKLPRRAMVAKPSADVQEKHFGSFMKNL